MSCLFRRDTGIPNNEGSSVKFWTDVGGEEVGDRDCEVVNLDDGVLRRECDRLAVVYALSLFSDQDSRL